MKEEKMPSLTEKIRIFALGGLDEDGKNLFCVEVDQSIYVIEAGIKFPDNKESLGIEFIIQDFTYLVENKNRVAGIFITHGHDDVMGALPYLLKQVPCDVYTAPLAVKEVQKMIRQEHITGVRVHGVKRNEKKRIGKRRVVFFPITHAYPGTFGLAIGTEQGYIVYSGEFIEDYDDLEDAYRADFTTISELGNEGVLVLLQESKGAERSGHTSPSHRISPKLLQVLETHENKRVFVSVYTQSVYRIQEIIDCCMANHRKMVFYTKELRDLVDRLKEIGYEVDPSLVIDPADFDNSMKDVVVIISGQGKSLFKTINNIANNELESIVFYKDVVIVVASTVVTGV